MMFHTRGFAIGALGLVLTFAGPALAQTFNSGSTGADGAFAPTCTPTPCTVTVTLPPSGVFNFTTINVPGGVTVTFIPNADHTPVTMLASGNVTIAGTIDVNGSVGGAPMAGTNLALPNGGAAGPGGYPGGSGTNALVSPVGGAGLGPGGGAGGVAGTFNYNSLGGGGGGGFGTQGGTGNGGTTGGATYGADTLLPLIGGSGGGGGAAPFGRTGGGGGGGGGAVLIASSGTITLTGTITAEGGPGVAVGCAGLGGPGGGGSGGAIRLAATSFAGTGGPVNVAGGAAGSSTCFAGGAGSAGRIRIEVFSNTSTISYTVPPSLDQPSIVALPNTPGLRITSVAAVAAPASPTGSYSAPDVTLPSGTTNPVAVVLAGSNIPPGTVVTVTSSGLAGGVTSATGTLSGTSASSTASVNVTIPTNEPTVISASCTFTLAALDGGPVYVQDEEVERVRVAATLGGLSQITWITRSGREIAAGRAQ